MERSRFRTARALLVATLLAGLATPALAASQGDVIEVTASTLNVRDGVWGRVLATATRGERFVVAESRSGWLGIDFAGSRAWVSSGYARRVAGAKVVVTTDALNVRTGPSTTNAAFGQARRGQAYARLGSQGDWVRVQFGRREGWVHGDYVRDVRPARTSSPPRGGDGGLVPPARRGAIRTLQGIYGAVRLNDRTLAMLENARDHLRAHGGCDPARALPRFVLQGSYNRGGVSASAGTHDGGGVIDIRVVDLPARARQALMRALRQAGFAAWIRTPPLFPYHIHAVAIGDPDLSPSARAQVAAYFRGRDGLARNGPDPHGGPVVKPWMAPFRP